MVYWLSLEENVCSLEYKAENLVLKKGKVQDVSNECESMILTSKRKSVRSYFFKCEFFSSIAGFLVNEWALSF